jgi:hypothetical protein
MDHRVLEPEWLDHLAAGDPRAQRARADLRRINAIMGSARYLASVLAAVKGSILDLGAGDGSVMLEVARRLKQPRLQVTLLDRAAPGHERLPPGFGRVIEDAFAFLERPGRFDAIVANLFLHHFDRAALARLLALAAARAPLFVAMEPRRSRAGLCASRLLWMIGCNAVTRHDAAVSVRAGFAGQELTQLWPARGSRCEERPAPPFGHLFVARHAAL